MQPHDLIEAGSQVFADPPPLAHVIEMKGLLSEGPGILMSDCVTPFDQLEELLAPIGIASIELIDLIPKLEAEPAEIRAEIAGIGVSRIQSATQEQGFSNPLRSPTGVIHCTRRSTHSSWSSRQNP